MAEYNIYCDESCHLPNDNCNVMALGSIWQLKEESDKTALDLRRIKRSHGLPAFFEVKWKKVSPAKIKFYESLVNYFFDEGNLHYRVVVVPDKSKLRHDEFSQTHDDWYYKMFFTLLKAIIAPQDIFNIYIDIKDTRSALKMRKLREVLHHSLYDFSDSIIKKIQPVRSEEVEQIQLTDLFTGIFTYHHRNLQKSSAKSHLVDLFSQRSGYSLDKTTLYKENKTNILIWRAQ
jgi:hypothetical protein